MARDQTQDGDRKGDDFPNQPQDTANGDANQLEREQEEPDERVENEGYEGQRPADHEQQAPKKEREHCDNLQL
jgi:hypothetical protein